MDNLDDLKLRIEQVITEIKDIKQIFETDMVDPRKDVSFSHVKEIESSIERLKKQGQPVPEEFNQLKLKLFSTYENHKEVASLYDKFLDSIHSLTLPKTPVRKPKTGQSPIRKPLNYIKPLGSKGNSNLEDYLIPVIQLMWQGYDHQEAFHQIAERLDVRYNTVNAQCTKALGLNTGEFISKVNSKTIVDLIENKYPDQYQTIKAQLKK
jgi:hypothetical protein